MQRKHTKAARGAKANKVRERLVPYAVRLYPDDVKRLEALAGRMPLPATAIARELVHLALDDVEQDPARLMGGSAKPDPREAARRCLGIYAHLAPGRSLADELIADRREEARREAEE